MINLRSIKNLKVCLELSYHYFINWMVLKLFIWRNLRKVLSRKVKTKNSLFRILVRFTFSERVRRYNIVLFLHLRLFDPHFYINYWETLYWLYWWDRNKLWNDWLKCLKIRRKWSSLINNFKRNRQMTLNGIGVLNWNRRGWISIQSTK